MLSHMPNKLIDIYRHVSGVHGFDYSRIEDDIYIGMNMCCEFGFKRELLSKGVTADISLEAERLDAPQGVEYFLWLPTPNQMAPTAAALEEGVQAIALLRAQGKKIYIHCKNGHGRAPTLYAAYLIRNGMSVEQALTSIATGRSSIHLEKAQIEALRRFVQAAPVKI